MWLAKAHYSFVIVPIQGMKDTLFHISTQSTDPLPSVQLGVHPNWMVPLPSLWVIKWNCACLWKVCDKVQWLPIWVRRHWIWWFTCIKEIFIKPMIGASRHHRTWLIQLQKGCLSPFYTWNKLKLTKIKELDQSHRYSR